MMARPPCVNRVPATQPWSRTHVYVTCRRCSRATASAAIADATSDACRWCRHSRHRAARATGSAPCVRPGDARPFAGALISVRPIRRGVHACRRTLRLLRASRRHTIVRSGRPTWPRWWWPGASTTADATAATAAATAAAAAAATAAAAADAVPRVWCRRRAPCGRWRRRPSPLPATAASA